MIRSTGVILASLFHFALIAQTPTAAPALPNCPTYVAAIEPPSRDARTEISFGCTFGKQIPVVLVTVQAVRDPHAAGYATAIHGVTATGFHAIACVPATNSCVPPDANSFSYHWVAFRPSDRASPRN